jgi:phosphoglycolate phosphatase
MRTNGKQVKNVIFDLDGTLVDSVPGIQWSVETAMKVCGLGRVCPDLTPLIGPPVRAILAQAAETADATTLDRLEEAFRSAYDSDGWRLTRCQRGTREALDQLRAEGCRLSIVTNKPAYATDLILRELAIHSYFEEIVCADSAAPPFASKEARLTDLLHRQGISDSESILVGDTAEDCQAAAGAGIACALVAHGYGSGPEGALPKGCRRISGWDELVEWCGALNGTIYCNRDE